LLSRKKAAVTILWALTGKTAGPVATQQTPPHFFEKTKRKTLSPRQPPSMTAGGSVMGAK
jgi:hypothetical protein